VSDKRTVRLLCTFLVLAGSAATVLAIVGWFPHNEASGTAWFPLAAAIGVAGLVWARPRKPPRAPTEW
jgi:hypothetical protein